MLLLEWHGNKSLYEADCKNIGCRRRKHGLYLRLSELYFSRSALYYPFQWIRSSFPLTRPYQRKHHIFIVLLNLGTAGAALATSFGFLCSTIYYLACLTDAEKKGNQLVSLSIKHFAPHRQMVCSVISIGIPGSLITVLLSVSNIVLNNFIGIYGSDAVAAYGIAYKTDMVPMYSF